MRPTYESSADRDREAAVATFYAEKTGVEMKRCPKFYPCDWAAMKGKELLALVEIKVRSKRYGTLMLSLHKASTMIHYAAVADCEPIVIVRWLDVGEVGFANLMQVSRRASWGGRADRGDSQDEEPVIHVPTEEFSVVPFA